VDEAFGVEEEEAEEVEDVEVEEGLSTTGLCSCFSLDVEGSIISPLARFRFLNFLLLFLRALSKAALIAKAPPGEVPPPGDTRAQANPVDVTGVATVNALRDAALDRPEVVASQVVPEDALEDFPEEHVAAVALVFADFPEAAPADDAVDTSDVLDVDFPQDIPEDAPSDDVPELASGDEPEDRPEEVPEYAEEEVFADFPEVFPEHLPEDAPALDVSVDCATDLAAFPLVLSLSPF